MAKKSAQRILTKKANQMLKKAEENERLREKPIANTFWKYFKKS